MSNYVYIVPEYKFTSLYNTSSYIIITFTDSSTWPKPDQLTVNLARRAHQPPGRLVDEDGLRGLPLAQREVQGQGGVPFLVRELVRFDEPLQCRRPSRSEDGFRLARQFPVVTGILSCSRAPCRQLE